MNEPMSLKILLVEDDVSLADLIKTYLEQNGFAVQIIYNGLEVEQQLALLQPNLVILDLMLPGKSGMDVCRSIRPKYTGPILMFTAIDDDFDHILGLELGADDYVIKPVQPRLLLGRINALLRRANKQVQTPVNTDRLTVDHTNMTIKIDEDDYELSFADFELFNVLAEKSGQVVSRDYITKKIRGFGYDGLDRSIDRRISRLRRKISGSSDKVMIKTVRNKGYQLCLYD